jgi:hypothetical protein
MRFRVAAFDNGLPWALTALPGRFVAVGFGPDGNQSWVSANGIDWEVSPAPDLPYADVTAVDGGVIAVGGVAQPGAAVAELASFRYPTRDRPSLLATCEPGPPTEATVWSSGDGLKWSREPRQHALIGVPMLAVAMTPDGRRAYGVGGGTSCNQPDRRLRSAAWYSDEPAHGGWHRLDAKALETGFIVDVATFAGGLVAVGTQEDIAAVSCPGAMHPRVWLMDKDAHWRAFDPGFGLGRILAVTASQSRIVALARIAANADDCTGHLAIWSSTDGRSWAASPDDMTPQSADSPVADFHLATIDAGVETWFVAAGPGIWISVDGVSWRRVIEPPGESLTAVTAGDQSVVAVGINVADSSGVAWVRPIAGP